MKFFYQSFLILLSCAIVFSHNFLPFSDLVFLILGLLGVFVYVFVWFKKKRMPEPLAIFGVVTIVIFLVFVTGKLSSSLFFLLYFVTFGLVFVFEPTTVFVFVLGLVAIFLPEILSNAVYENILKVGSIVLVSPLAFFFGREHKKETQKNKK